jgi:hypothetical protein
MNPFGVRTVIEEEETRHLAPADGIEEAVRRSPPRRRGEATAHRTRGQAANHSRLQRSLRAALAPRLCYPNGTSAPQLC